MRDTFIACDEISYYFVENYDLKFSVSIINNNLTGIIT